jgi:hypothetical protein
VAGTTEDDALERARFEIADVADAFRAAAAPALATALTRRLDALIEARGDWWEPLAEDVRTGFRSATEGAMRTGVADAMRRLEDEDVWLHPLVAPGIDAQRAGWDASFPAWLHTLVRRFASTRRGPVLEALDDPGNRIWLALVSAARPVDPVLEEFGLAPSGVPSVGGGHYGLAPKTAEQLDPSGAVLRVWRRYRLAHQRYVALAQGGPDRTR